MYFHGEYEPATTAVLRNHLHPGDVFVDVGANAGYFSALAASLVGPTGRVIAFEPSPATCRLLDITAQMNPCIEAHQVAVGDREGVAQLHLSAEPTNSGMSSLLSRAGTRGGKVVEVPVKRLDDLLLEVPKVNAIKIDVEGFELSVLRGGENLFTLQRPDLVVIEVAREDGTPRPEEIVDAIRDLDYDDIRLVDDGRGFTQIGDLPHGVAANLVATHTSR